MPEVRLYAREHRGWRRVPCTAAAFWFGVRSRRRFLLSVTGRP